MAICYSMSLTTDLCALCVCVYSPDSCCHRYGGYSSGSPDEEDPRRHGVRTSRHICSVELLKSCMPYCFVIWRASCTLLCVVLLPCTSPGAINYQKRQCMYCSYKLPLLMITVSSKCSDLVPSTPSVKKYKSVQITI